MKKLNKKGFTLIELLAVIVILAIIVVVTVPTVLNSINDARLSSLHSLSKEFANWYDTAVAQDQLAMTGEKILGTAIVPEEGYWICISDVSDGDKNLADLYGLSESDLDLSGYSKNNYQLAQAAAETDSPVPYAVSENDATNCSAIRIKNGRAEVYLLAKDTGKFSISGQYVYANSTDSEAKTMDKPNN